MLLLLPLEVKHGQSTGLGSHFGRQAGSAAGAAPPCTQGESGKATVGLTWKVLISPVLPPGVGVDREASFLCYEEVLFCIAVHDSFFIICTCLKFIERGNFFFPEARVVVLWWVVGYASESLISLT